MTPLETVSDAFGSMRKAALAVGVSIALVSRWNTRKHGRIPPEYNHRFRQAAASLPAKDRDRVLAVLDPDVCPTCGQPVERGRVL